MSGDEIAVLVFQKRGSSVWDESSEDRAREAYQELMDLNEKGKAQIHSATLVVRGEDGRARLKKTSDQTKGKRAGRGAFWGLLVGLVLGGPVAGLLAGLGLGAFKGGKKEGGIDQKFLKELGEQIRPGNAAIFMLIPAGDADTMQHLEAYDASLYTTALTDDVHEAVEKATQHEEVLAAIEFDELD
jgi:uncharacterized membrane protein